MLSADVANLNADNLAWDTFGGLPDPYIILTATDFIDTFRGQSAYDADTTSPVWGENVLTAVPAEALQASLTIRVMDSDTFADNVMAECVTQVTEDLFTGNTLSITCPESENLTEATVRFQIHRN